MTSQPDFPASFRLDGKVAVVTGGASGIGRAAANILASAGAAVAVLDRDGKAAETAAHEIAAGSNRTLAMAVDVTEEQKIVTAFQHIVTGLGGLDILVNSAGIAIRTATVEHRLEDWNKVIDVNMTGVFLCARHAAKIMIERKHGGSIVNIASMMGLSGGGLYPNVSYQSSKGAVVNMTRALAVEWARLGIRVNAVAPTYVRTPLIAPLLAKPELMKRIEDMTPLGCIAEPEDVAGAVLYLASPAARMVTGHTLAVDGGFLAQ